jgi:N-acetylglucosaminyldiphosphoundecaprenol N-acetyl-beta-D-mannosaminyltransferase
MLLHKSPFVLPDGVGIAIAARIWGSKICNNLNGTDLFPELCRRAAATGISIAFLGGRQGIAAECARLMVARYPGLQIVWVGHGYLSPAEEAQLIPELNASGASLLFVAKGVPTQEIWIRDNAPNLDIPILIGVGALFDFYSGAMPRAPAFLRKLRLEWLFRLFMEPARMFKRYVIGNPQFIIRTIRQRIVGH